MEEQDKHREERTPHQLDRRLHSRGEVCCTDHNNEGGKSGAEAAGAIPEGCEEQEGNAAAVPQQAYLSVVVFSGNVVIRTPKLANALRVSWMCLSRDSWVSQAAAAGPGPVYAPPAHRAGPQLPFPIVAFPPSCIVALIVSAEVI